MKWVKAYAQNIIDLVLPPRCMVSGDKVDTHGMIAPHVWRKLNFITDPFCARCGLPFEYETEVGLHCPQCLEDPPEYHRARAPLRYDDGSRDLILAFKHADQTQIVRSFTPWLMRAGEDMWAEIDTIIPVPLHYARIVKRRYNQSALIARLLEHHTQIPATLGVLKRQRHTQSQGHLSPILRRKNVRQAFSVTPEKIDKIKGKSILLVDDVFTTGATVRECSRILLRAGAKRVEVLTLARACKTGHS